MVVPLIFSSLSKPPLKCGGHTIRLGGSHNNQVASSQHVPRLYGSDIDYPY